MHRHALRDDQWIRIKDFLPGRDGHVGGTASNNRLFVDAVVFRFARVFPGVICQSVSAMVSPSTGAIADGA